MQEDRGRTVAEAAVAYLTPIGGFDDPWRDLAVRYQDRFRKSVLSTLPAALRGSASRKTT